MSKDKRLWSKIVDVSNTPWKVMALITLVAESLFITALTKLKDQNLLYALFTCAGILVVTLIGIVIIKIAEKKVSNEDNGSVNASDKTPKSDFSNELVKSAIHTVCRAVSLPQTPQSAKLRVFIFRKEKDQLICTHFWSQDPVKEQVGKLKFQLNSGVANNVAVVRAALDNKICRTAVNTLPSGIQGVDGDVDDDLKFVLAAPINDKKGNVLGTVDFDTASEVGMAMLSTEVAGSVMFQLAQHLSVIFAFEKQSQEAIS